LKMEVSHEVPAISDFALNCDSVARALDF